MAKILNKAKKTKNDEFYTLYEDIEKELKYYSEYFENKVVYCNCDTKDSNFYKYFKENFEVLKLKDLLISDGLDFRSEESINLLKKCDVVVTNPPFSLAGDFLAQLVDYNKDYIFIGHDTFITLKLPFALFREGKFFVGNNKVRDFVTPEKEIKSVNCHWFTNLKDYVKHKEPLNIKITYEEGKKLNLYEQIDDFPEILGVNRIKDIPIDYDGLISVPIITLIFKDLESKGFKIIDNSKGYISKSGKKGNRFKVNGKTKFDRLVIKKSV